MADKDVVINDLFESVGSHPEYYTDVDGVHLNQTGIEAAAKEKYSAVRSPMIHTDGADPAGQPAGRKVEKIELIFSKGEDGRWDERRWEIQELPLPKKEGKVTFKVPEGASMFFVNVTTEGDIIASSPCIKVAS